MSEPTQGVNKEHEIVKHCVGRLWSLAYKENTVQLFSIASKFLILLNKSGPFSHMSRKAHVLTHGLFTLR